MKRVSLVPNIITAFGLACGLFVIFKVNMIEPGTGDYEVIFSSALILILAAFADFIDGAIARAFQVESEFGFMFDSLADTVSFGVAPAVLLLKSLSLEQGSFLSFFAATGAMVFSLCGVVRLVRFNVKAMVARKDLSEEKGPKVNKPFTGLPITAAAAASVSLTLFFVSPLVRSHWYIDFTCKAFFLAFVMILLGYLMVSKIAFPSLKALHYRIRSFPLAFFTVALAILALYGILHYFSVVLALLAWSYIFIALFFALYRKLFRF